MIPQDGIPYRRWFPWLHLFRAISIGLSIRQLIVACGAVGVLWLAQTGLDQIIPDESSLAASVVDWSIDFQAPLIVDPTRDFPDRLTMEATRPWGDLVLPVTVLLDLNETPGRRLKSACYFAVAIAIWSVFGLILCRLAGRRVAKDEAGSFRKSVQFGLSRSIHGIVAPLLPIAAASLSLVCAVVAIWASGIPWVGALITIPGIPFATFCCLIAGILIVAVLLGWPLMLAAVAWDDCDGFGSLSRSYSMWTGRFWYFAWNWMVAVVVGVIALLMANTIAHGTLTLLANVSRFRFAESSTNEFMVVTNLYAIAVLVRAYGISVFWTSATIIYGLLRHSVDGMPIDVIRPDDDERPPRDPLPVVGMPAMDHE